MSLDPAVRSRSQAKKQPAHHEIAHHTKVGPVNAEASA